MFFEPVEPTFEQKRGETKPALHLAPAESPFSPQKGIFLDNLQPRCLPNCTRKNRRHPINTETTGRPPHRAPRRSGAFSKRQSCLKAVCCNERRAKEPEGSGCRVRLPGGCTLWEPWARLEVPAGRLACGPLFVNAQYEAVRRRIPFDSGR